MAYIRAIASGNYSSGSTWNGGVAPGAGDIACADNYRITMDVDTDAVLSVAAADLVLAGGSAAAIKVGGFVVPPGATRSFPGGLRYDHYISATRTGSATAPVYMTHGTLSMGPIAYVGTSPLSSAAAYLVAVQPATGSTANVTAAGDISIPRDLSATTNTKYAYYFDAAVGATVNFTLSGIITYTGTLVSAPMRAVGTSPTACPYSLTINTDIPTWGGSGSTTTFEWSFGSTGAEDQNVIITPATFVTSGGASVSYGRALLVGSVHNMAFTNPAGVTIGNTTLNSSDYEITVNSLRGSMTFAGPLTLQGQYIITILAGAGSLVLPDTTINATHNATMISHAGTGDLITGDLTLAYTGAATGGASIGAIAVVGNSQVTVNGNLAYVPGCTMFMPILYFSGSSSKSCTINGDVDGRYAYTASSTSEYGVMTRSSARTGPIIINGNVYGSDAGTATVPNTSAGAVHYTAASPTTYQPVTINGSVYGGSRCPGVRIPSTATVECTVTGSVVAGAVGAGYKYAAPGVVAENQPVRVGALVFGPEGQFPVYGLCTFITPSVASVTARDTTLSSFVMNSTTAIVPAATDVRSGTAVGTTVGSLVVPSAANVLGGVVFDNGTVGTLDVASDIAAIKAKTDQLAFTTGNVHALPTNAADVTAIKDKTDQLAFTLDGVVADSSGVAADYTSRFNSLDTVTAGIKAKTDQLAFTVNGVLADAGIADYTSRFNALDAAVAAIPTITYTTRFNSIDTDLDNLIAGGGVDFTPVLDAITIVNTNVASVGSTASAVKTKTDQLAFTVDGVVADVSVSVGNVINYDARFDALDLSSAGIKAKTDQLTFGAGGVNAVATVDTAPIVAAVNTAISATNTAIANLDADLVTHDTEIKAQLTTIQNATGAIDLTPITTSLATINANVLNIPTTTYTTRFNTIDSALVAVMSDLADIETGLGSVGVDLTPVLSAVAGVQADTDALQVAVGNISIDLSPVTSAVAGVQSTANAIKAKTDTITPCDVGALADAIDALESRFAAVPDGPVAIIPQGDSNTTTLFGYCYNQDGSPASGKTVTFYVQQARGHGALLDSAGQVKTSGVTGLVTCVVPRGTQYVYAVQFGNRIERINGVDAETLEIPSIIARQ